MRSRERGVDPVREWVSREYKQSIEQVISHSYDSYYESATLNSCSCPPDSLVTASRVTSVASDLFDRLEQLSTQVQHTLSLQHNAIDYGQCRG